MTTSYAYEKTNWFLNLYGNIFDSNGYSGCVDFTKYHLCQALVAAKDSDTSNLYDNLKIKLPKCFNSTVASSKCSHQWKGHNSSCRCEHKHQC